MDHLPTPHSTIKKLPVPFLAVEPYDGDVFTTYPSRHGWSVTGPLMKVSIERYHVLPPPEEAGSLLQTWLFFGLIFAVTGQQPDSDHFKKVDKSGNAILTTVCLGDMISL
jgi:hypothetical protein